MGASSVEGNNFNGSCEDKSDTILQHTNAAPIEEELDTAETWDVYVGNITPDRTTKQGGNKRQGKQSTWISQVEHLQPQKHSNKMTKEQVTGKVRVHRVDRRRQIAANRTDRKMESKEPHTFSAHWSRRVLLSPLLQGSLFGLCAPVQVVHFAGNSLGHPTPGDEFQVATSLGGGWLSTS